MTNPNLPSQQNYGQWPGDNPVAQEVEELQEILNKLKKVQFGVVELTYPGGSQEPPAIKVKLEKELPPAPANSFFLTIFASGVRSLPFIGPESSLTELQIGCITTDGSLPVAGSKQKIFWLVISSA